MQSLRTFRNVAHWLKCHNIQPRDVEVRLVFRDQRDRDRAAYALGKELDCLRWLPEQTDYFFDGSIHGLPVKLVSAA